MNWRDAAIQHATQELPREACGLVVIIKGRKRYWPAKNLAVGTDQFILAPEDYAAADDAGDVVAIVHSHPNLPCAPSQADMVSCEASGLPWHIVSVPAGQWHYMEPTGYQAPLVGREWSHGVLDCYSLIRDWYAQERGLQLPDFARRDEWWLRGENLYLEHFSEAGFIQIDPADIEPGDGILMRVASPVTNHGAVYLGDNRIIHHVQNRLSCRDIYSDFWRDRTTHVLRHENHHSAW